METKTKLDPKKKYECGIAIVKQLSKIARKQLVEGTPEHISVWGNLNK